MSQIHVKILLPLPTDQLFSYWSDGPLQIGQIVRVPFGRRFLDGTVWSVDETVDATLADRMKHIHHVYNLPVLSPRLCRFVETMAEYTLSARGLVIKMVLNVDMSAAERAGAAQKVLAASAPGIVGETSRQQAVLDKIQECSDVYATKHALAKAAGVSASVVQRMCDRGVLMWQDAPRSARGSEITKVTALSSTRKDQDFQLNPEQQTAAEVLIAACRAQAFSVTVLQGVTGSGKTAVYLAAIRDILEKDQQVLVLVPEIMLSHPWAERFATGGDDRTAIWHSDVSPGQRAKIWASVARGDTKVVVGVRSAVLLPFADLGLIVVDEEHDPTYKQEDGVIYHARDMAIFRAQNFGIPVVLVSATPSCETHYNLQQARYRSVNLSQRYHQVTLPRIECIDMRMHPPEKGAWLSPPLLKTVAQTLSEGGQSFLFINRRGYAPLTLCQACGHRIECPHCAVSLVEHRQHGRLLCHYCGHTQKTPSTCPQCGAADQWIAYGPGAERIYDEVRQALPAARLLLVTSDTLGSSTEGRAALDAVHCGEVDIIVGTQILAKGHDFENLRCVAVVNADQGLAGVDLRASERTFQVLDQVTGRSGRHKPGVACLQTYSPEHPLLMALQSGNRTAFWEQEIATRARAGMPPHVRLLAVILAGKDPARVEEFAKAMVRCAPEQQGIEVMGPVLAPLAKLRGSYRWRILVRASRTVRLQPWARAWMAVHRQLMGEERAINVTWDVDPQTFL